jgi:hypothetical protein
MRTDMFHPYDESRRNAEARPLGQADGSWATGAFLTTAATPLAEGPDGLIPLPKSALLVVPEIDMKVPWSPCVARLLLCGGSVWNS